MNAIVNSSSSGGMKISNRRKIHIGKTGQSASKSVMVFWHQALIMPSLPRQDHAAFGPVPQENISDALP
jgi:hypothetical protein